MHPYIPHITEVLYGHVTGGKILANSDWPTATLLERSKETEKDITHIFDIVRTIRNIRAESGVKPGEFRDVCILGPKKEYENLLANATLIQ